MVQESLRPGQSLADEAGAAVSSDHPPYFRPARRGLTFLALWHSLKSVLAKLVAQDCSLVSQLQAHSSGHVIRGAMTQTLQRGADSSVPIAVNITYNCSRPPRLGKALATLNKPDQGHTVSPQAFEND